MPLVVTAPAGSGARTVLRERIQAAKAGDPLVPVTVAVLSPYAGLSLRRHLGSQPGGLVNVAFLALARIAELLGASALAAAGRRPLPAAVRREALRVLLGERGGLFGPIAGHPTTIRALDRTLVELRACSAESLSRLAQASLRAAEIVDLYRSLRARLEANWYDDHDLAVAAAGAVREGSPVLGDIGHVVVFCPRRLEPSRAILVEALGDAATVIEAVDDGFPPSGTAIVGCADPDEEVRAAVRGVTERLARPEPMPLYRMAILHPPGGPYATIAHQQLAAAGLPCNGPAGRTLALTVAGRALLGLLDLCAGDLARNELAAWLASAPIVEQGGGRELAPAAHWDTISRRAGVVAGPGHWKERLDNLAADLHRQAGRHEAQEPGAGEDDAKSQQRRRRIEHDMKSVERLHLFVEELHAALDAGSRTTWTAMSAWAAGLLHRYLGEPHHRLRWPEEEQKALDDVHLLLGRLADLDAMGASVDLAAFHHAVALELEAPAGHRGTFGDGVFVGPLSAAWAADFDTVFVLGLAEGSLPRPGRQDALLPESERRTAGELSLRSDGQGEEHGEYLAALASAPERILLWPRADLRAGRRRLPSRWLLDTASHLAGRPVFSGELAALVASEHGVHDVASFEAGVGHAGEPASVLDLDLASLLDWKAAGGDVAHHHLVAASPALAAGMAATVGRESVEFTRFDGNIPAVAADALVSGAVLSATSLQTYAQCPLRYFLTRQLGLEAEEKPENLLTIGAMERGTLVHAILEDYVKSVVGGRPRFLEHLLEMAETHFTAVEARGLTGRRALWRYERQKMVRELERIHALDAGTTPLAAELSFGDGVHDPVTLTLPNGRTISFRGQADRVDRDAAGGLVVTDYKTGGSDGYKVIETDPVDRGRKLQLPLYALAARQCFADEGNPVPLRSRYWIISEKGGFKEFAIEVNGKVLDRFGEVLAVIVDGITAGNFPARPGKPGWKGPENCRWCDMGSLCQQDRERQWERNKNDPALASYVELAEGDPTGEKDAADG